MVQFLKVPVSGNENNFETKLFMAGINDFIFQNSFNCH